jgi:hypothetical protein
MTTSYIASGAKSCARSGIAIPHFPLEANGAFGKYFGAIS